MIFISTTADWSAAVGSFDAKSDSTSFDTTCEVVRVVGASVIRVRSIAAIFMSGIVLCGESIQRKYTM